MTAQSKVSADQASVYAKIAAVQGELAQTGISKDSENSFDRYKFRGIDAVYNALAPLLAKHGLCVLPRIIERESVERQSRKGEPLFYVTVAAEFDFVSADDGSAHTVRTYGEAMDRSDKATNKAMSAAYKYAAFMAFAIPTEGDNDADASTPEVEPAARGQNRGDAESPSQPSRVNWGGRYPNKTALRKARVIHHAEIERIGVEGTFDDLDGYLTSPEYQDYIKTANEQHPLWLEGEIPEEMREQLPAEYVQTFALETKARDMIAIRGNVAVDAEPA